MRLNDRNLHSGAKTTWIRTGTSVQKVYRIKRVNYNLSMQARAFFQYDIVDSQQRISPC